MVESRIKQFAREVVNEINQLAYENARNKYILKFWSWFSNKYIGGIISNKNDDELKRDLKRIYDKMSPIFSQVNTGYELAEGYKLGSPKFPLLNKDLKDVMKIVDEYAV